MDAIDAVDRLTLRRDHRTNVINVHGWIGPR